MGEVIDIRTRLLSTSTLEAQKPMLKAPTPPENVSFVLKELLKLCSLEVGWDGYQAKPVSSDTAIWAYQVYNTLAGAIENLPVPNISPGLYGNLQLEWFMQGVEIELHFHSQTIYSFWCNDTEICPEGDDIFLKDDLSKVYVQLLKLVTTNNATAKAYA